VKKEINAKILIYVNHLSGRTPTERREDLQNPLQPIPARSSSNPSVYCKNCFGLEAANIEPERFGSPPACWASTEQTEIETISSEIPAHFEEHCNSDNGFRGTQLAQCYLCLLQIQAGDVVLRRSS
jgi:hypothetical protein